MILKNLLRRKARTLLTVLGIGVGVAAIIGLGTLANALEAGYDAMIQGSKADFVVSQPNAFDISFSAVDETLGDELEFLPEVSAVSGMIQGIVQTPEMPYFFVYGYPQNSFLLDRVRIIEGSDLTTSTRSLGGGDPILLGSGSAENFGMQVGDSIRLSESTFRIVGIYQTGETLEDRGAILSIENAQNLLGMQQQVSLFYIQLENPSLAEKFRMRAERLLEDLSLSSTDDFASKQSMVSVLQAYVIGISGLAILIGSVGMINTQLMAVVERTREIGVLRSVGWSRARVMAMILSESLLLSIVGGIVGLLLGVGLLSIMGSTSVLLAGVARQLNGEVLLQAFIVVLPLGLIGGSYPAWRATRITPVEALRYEGGTFGSQVRRLPFGGMALQELWQRSTRSLLTLAAIGLTVGGILALEGVVRGAGSDLNSIALGTQAEIMIRQADATSSSQSVIDERIGNKITQLEGVEYVSGMIMTAVTLPEGGGLFMLQGYSPTEFAIRRFPIVEGQSLTGNRQILLGRVMAETLGKGVGDVIEVGGSRFRISGIFETGVAWEEIGGVITLRDAQSFLGRPRKVTMLAVKVEDPNQAEAVVSLINNQYPSVLASLSGSFAEQTPDMKLSNYLLGGISVLAIAGGGLGVLNTMFMSVLERTREIGVLRALGWGSGRVMQQIVQESLIMGVAGGGLGVAFAFTLTGLLKLMPAVGDALTPLWHWTQFLRAGGIALALGVVGGLYPAFRATHIKPIDAIRYE
ncbi:MAG: ABC transporter permease [Anaerolineales bacterium]|jgi:ABC-type antimicrobial peptide transport system permease subunit